MLALYLSIRVTIQRWLQSPFFGLRPMVGLRPTKSPDAHISVVGRRPTTGAKRPGRTISVGWVVTVSAR